MARYAGLFLAPAEFFSQGFFFAFWAERQLIILFWPILGQLVEKSCIWESPTLSTDVNSRTDTVLEILFIYFFWVGWIQIFFGQGLFFFGKGGSKTFNNKKFFFFIS